MSSDKWWKKGYYYGSWKKGKEEKTTTSSYSWYDDDYDYYDDDVAWGSETGYTPRYKSSLGWGSGRLLSSTSYSYYGSSSYFSHSGADGEEINKLTGLLSSAYRMARDMIVILDFPFDVHLQISSNFYINTTNTKWVFIPTTVFNKGVVMEDQDKINIFCGLGVHEAAHLKYTSKIVLDDYIRQIKDKSATIDPHLNEQTIPFLLDLVNMIEDERVEDELLKDRPGYVDFIALEKNWDYRLFTGTEKLDGCDEAEKFLNNLYRLIRFPAELDEEIIEKYSEQYERIKKLVTPLPASTKESCVMAIKVFKEIFNIFSELHFKSPDRAMFNQSQKHGSLSYMECFYGNDKISNIREIKQQMDKNTGGEISANGIVSQLVEGEAEKGAGKDSFIKSEKGDKGEYDWCLKRVSSFVPAIKKLLKGVDKNYDFNIYGCRAGLLDTNKLAEAYQGIPQVYIRKGHVRTNKTTVCVLVDESGSMGYNDDTRCSAYVARDAAVLLNEALKDLPGVDLYIYGHSADQIYEGSTELYVYREGKATKDQYALSNIRGRVENRDGEAILEAAKRVRKHTSGHCIMFVISDGQPYALNYWGRPAIKDVREKVTEVEKMDFTVIQVSIDYVDRANEMFSTCISLEHDLANFPKRLSKVIKDAIVNDKKTTIS